MEQQIKERIESVETPDELTEKVELYLEENPEERWTDAIDDIADDIIPEGQEEDEEGDEG